MSENKDEPVQESTAQNPENEGAGPRRSTVDALFDTMTSRTARGLRAAQVALESVARWLDGQAKAVGELAAKLSAPPTSPGGSPPAESPAS